MPQLRTHTPFNSQLRLITSPFPLLLSLITHFLSISIVGTDTPAGSVRFLRVDVVVELFSSNLTTSLLHQTANKLDSSRAVTSKHNGLLYFLSKNKRLSRFRGSHAAGRGQPFPRWSHWLESELSYSPHVLSISNGTLLLGDQVQIWTQWSLERTSAIGAKNMTLSKFDFTLYLLVNSCVCGYLSNVPIV